MAQKIVIELTTYEKFLRLPKIVMCKTSGGTQELEFYFDLQFNTKHNDDCCIEYTRADVFGDYYSTGKYWHGTFEECVNNAYEYFHKKGGLLEDENS